MVLRISVGISAFIQANGKTPVNQSQMFIEPKVGAGSGVRSGSLRGGATMPAFQENVSARGTWRRVCTHVCYAAWGHAQPHRARETWSRSRALPQASTSV